MPIHNPLIKNLGLWSALNPYSEQTGRHWDWRGKLLAFSRPLLSDSDFGRVNSWNPSKHAQGLVRGTISHCCDCPLTQDKEKSAAYVWHENIGEFLIITWECCLIGKIILAAAVAARAHTHTPPELGRGISRMPQRYPSKHWHWHRTENTI